MIDSFDAALLEFAATAAALNARALDRAGLLDDFERSTMHAMLDFAEGYAELLADDKPSSIVRSVRQCLPRDVEHSL
jgi:hypothetical protein